MSNVHELLFPYDEDHIAVKQATEQGFILLEWGLADLSYPTSKLRRAEYKATVGYARHLWRELRTFIE